MSKQRYTVELTDSEVLLLNSVLKSRKVKTLQEYIPRLLAEDYKKFNK